MIRGFKVYGDVCLENASVAHEVILPFGGDMKETDKCTRSYFETLVFGPALFLTAFLEGASDNQKERYNDIRAKVAPARLHIDLKAAHTKKLKVCSKLGLSRLTIDIDGLTYDTIQFARRRLFSGARGTRIRMREAFASRSTPFAGAEFTGLPNR